MKVAVMVLNFGEPENATMEEVVPYLEKIFMLGNTTLGSNESNEQMRVRAHELAIRRAPSLIEEYELIGNSPNNAQARAEALGVERELRARGHEVVSYVGMQFTDPSVEDAVRRAHDDGAELVIGLPVYPICGPTTTVAALAQMRRAIDALGWNVPVCEITGWHTHTAYIEIRAEVIRRTLIENEVDLSDPRTRLVFSAHGTPMHYIRQGSRYVLYVEHAIAAIARELDVQDYALGYQNHSNRPIEWTQPDIVEVIDTIDADTVVIDPCTFMHEQSETLAELDHELKDRAEARGLRFVRVPIPHDDPRFYTLLADLCEPFIQQRYQEAGFRPCLCRPGAYCLNSVIE